MNVQSSDGFCNDNLHVAVTRCRLTFPTMATQPSHIEHTSAGDARMRKLCWIAIVVALLLGAYAATLSWATRTVEAGVERSLQPVPAVMRDRPDLGR